MPRRGSRVQIPSFAPFFLTRWRHGQEVRQRSATPIPPVRFWVPPPKKKCRSGGIGRRTGLKILRWRHRTGSIPVFGTSSLYLPMGEFFYFMFFLMLSLINPCLFGKLSSFSIISASCLCLKLSLCALYLRLRISFWLRILCVSHIRVVFPLLF